MDFFLYNPLSNKNRGEERAKELVLKWKEKYNTDCTLVNQIEINPTIFFNDLREDDRVIVSGGDGTIHHFANKIKNIEINNDIFFIPSGTGNDFYEDIKIDYEPINQYITNLPSCKFLGNDLVFVNGCGLGLDGYVCYLVNHSNKKKHNSFTKSALKAFRKYKKTDIEVIIDEETHSFKDVYLASIMNGRYQGGGMMMSPSSNRIDDKIELCLVYGMSKFRFLLAFPKVFKGKHLKYKKNVKILSGNKIIIKSNNPLYMQIDGEDYENIEYIETEKN